MRALPALIVLVVLALTTPAVVPAAAQVPPRDNKLIPRTASIRGRVTAADTGVPLRLVQVRVSTAPGFKDVTVTDAEGRYQFVGLGSGSYAATFTKAGFVTLQYGQREPQDQAKFVDLREGDVLEKVDAALPRGAAIEGHVFDESGEPVAEATVTALRLQFVDGERRLEPEGRAGLTNDKGQYRVYGLQAGDYYVSALLRTLAPLATSSAAAPSTRDVPGYAPIFYADAVSLADARRITVGPGEDVTAIDIVFRPLKLARVSGVLVPSRGIVLDGAIVFLTSIVQTWPRRGGGVGRAGTGGTFNIEGVEPGEYVLQALSVTESAISEVARTGRSLNRMLAGPDAEFANVRVTVGGADVTGLVIPMSAAGHLRGRVTLDGQGYKGWGSWKVGVSVVPAGPDSVMGFSGTTAAPGPDGSFEVHGLVGKFVLRLRDDIGSSVTLARVIAGGVDVTDDGVSVPPGGEVSDIEVAVTSRPHELLVRVTAEDADQVTSSTVVVFSEDPQRWSWPATRYVATARPDPDGSFRVSGLPVGRYLAIAVAHVEQGRWLDPDFLRSLAGRATLVELKDGERRTVELRLNLR